MNAVFEDRRRLAPWWMCTLMLLIAAFFGYVISEAYGKPSGGGVFTRFLILPYCVWIYLTLGALLNRQLIRVTTAGVRVSTGPVLMGMNETIPRDRIAFCYHFSVLVTSDDAGSSDKPFAIGHVAGVETIEGRQVVLTEPNRDLATAREFAAAIAVALNPASPVQVKALQDPRTDPTGTRRAWLWGGIWGAAILAGSAWEIARRYGATQ